MATEKTIPEDAAKSAPKKKPAKTAAQKKKPKKNKRTSDSKSKKAASNEHADYPRHSLKKVLRIPLAILDQNGGRDCTEKEALSFCGLGFHGPNRLEMSSAIKYGLLVRPKSGSVALTPLARRILRPTTPADEIAALRTAVINAPQIGEVYKHYRGENIPDEPFFSNTVIDTYGVPKDKVPEFKSIYLESLTDANLLETRGDKTRVVDVSEGEGVSVDSESEIKQLGKVANVQKGDSCFVMMPFANPIGSYYERIFQPAIEKTGLRAVRADDDMFAVGKIIDQIWGGIHAAKVLVAELTGRNPNVFYELGLAHALKKPVVLVACNEGDVPFDVKHIRVIYYDKDDPFWGEKLMKKISENVLSAINNPEEAIFKQNPTAN